MRLIFVDDEPLLLQGLHRSLRSMAGEWTMEFVSNGPEALERMAAEPFDVVVTDMRMPGMDGAQLLQEVQKRHPETVRFVPVGPIEPGSRTAVHRKKPPVSIQAVRYQGTEGKDRSRLPVA